MKYGLLFELKSYKVLRGFGNMLRGPLALVIFNTAHARVTRMR